MAAYRALFWSPVSKALSVTLVNVHSLIPVAGTPGIVMDVAHHLGLNLYIGTGIPQLVASTCQSGTCMKLIVLARLGRQKLAPQPELAAQPVKIQQEQARSHILADSDWL